jgi:hypothetical protein
MTDEQVRGFVDSYYPACGMYTETLRPREEGGVFRLVEEREGIKSKGKQLTLIIGRIGGQRGHQELIKL